MGNEPLHPGNRIVAQVGDEDARGEVIKSAAFGRPVINSRAASEYGLGWSISAKRPRLMR
jgi:hypothetical protein